MKSEEVRGKSEELRIPLDYGLIPSEMTTSDFKKSEVPSIQLRTSDVKKVKN